MLSALGRTTFEDASIPVPGKSEFGMDTLVREVEGYVGENGENLIAYIASLNQGDTYLFGDTVFYLQTWSPGNSTPVASVTLNYKGLKPGGTPEPDIETQIVAATGGTSADFSAFNDGIGVAYRKEPFGDPESPTLINIYTTSATLEFTYNAAQSTYSYITTGKPSGPRFEHIDIEYTPVIKTGRTRVANGEVFGFEGPIAVGPAVQPVPRETVIGFTSKHVIGSPFWECQDVVRMELVQAD